LRLSGELTGGLKGVSRGEEVTLFMTLLAGLQVLMSRYTGQEEMVVGTAIDNRTRRQTERLIGFFVNTLALATKVGGEPTVAELLKRVREVAWGRYGHQEVPFEKVV